jgi:hypothetical protein
MGGLAVREFNAQIRQEQVTVWLFQAVVSTNILFNFDWAENIMNAETAGQELKTVLAIFFFF